MKRLIKFRGKRIDTGEWIFGYYLEFSLCDGEGRCSYIKIDGCQPIKVHPESIGQFTGLLDKNGKEIYNGDILSTNGRMLGYVVDGVRGYCYDLVYVPPRRNEYSWSLYSVVTDDYPNEIEVIGSIHDNPELLKGGNQ